jgi:RNA polymerase sigma-70 factor (ECF subfamily)
VKLRAELEEQILDAISRGEYDRAFNLIVENYDQRLYWHIRRMVQVHDDADDVLQECFIKVWRNLPRFRSDSAVYTWLYRIATNESLSFLKKRNRRGSAHLNSEMEDYQLESDAYFDEKAANARFELAISKLPEKQRLVFNMKYFEEMKYDDMSEILDTSVGALKASYHHAVKKIKDMLRED